MIAVAILLLASLGAQIHLGRQSWLKSKPVLARVVLFVCLTQSFWLNCYVLLGGYMIPTAGFDGVVAFADYWKEVLVAIWAPFLGALIGCRLTKNVVNEGALELRSPLVFRLFLWVCALSPALYYIITQVRIPLLSPVLGFLYYSLAVSPFLVGYFAHREKTPAVVLLASILFTAVFAITEGSRAVVFLPMAYAAVGYIVGIPDRRSKIVAIASFAISGLVALQVSGLIGVIRDQIKLDTSTVSVGEVLEALDRIRTEDIGSSGIENLQSGIARMVNWSYFAVAAYVPNALPARGFSGMGEEVKIIGQSTAGGRSGFEILEEQVAAGVGQGSASMYGFAVSAGGTVPFPVTADAWSRFGALGALVAFMLFALLFGLVERLIRFVSGGSYHIALIGITVMGAAAYDRVNSYAVFYTLKFGGLLALAWFPALLALNFVEKAAVKNRIRR